MTADLARTRVFIGLPWMKQTNPVTAFSVAGLIDRRRTALSMVHGDAFVAHSRNKLATLFLDSGMDWMLSIDDDMIVPFGDANWFNAFTGFALPKEYAGLHAMNRLLSHGKTLVGALYFGRHKHGAPMYAEGANVPAEAAFARKAPHALLKPTRWVATGCMLTHRSVFEDIEKRFPRLARANNRKGGQWFSTSETEAMDLIEKTRALLADGPMTGEKCLKAYQLLETGHESARRNSSLGMGEDVQFCTRAMAAGHQPYVDMALVCGHIGTCAYGPANTSPMPKR
jgi:hypothetical protein